jgi:molybdopterin-binding protein
MGDELRPGQAAEMLAVTVDTLRRWEAHGKLRVSRSAGGQRRIPVAEVRRLLGERAAVPRAGRAIVATSARNRLAGVVTAIEKDRVAATVEVQAGPFRLLSLMTAEAVDDMALAVGDEVVCVVKATNVIVDVPSGRERR